MNPAPPLEPTEARPSPPATSPTVGHARPMLARQRAAWQGLLRGVAILIVCFVLAMTGYYLYVDVINRPPAEVYIVNRGTAVSAVYGTVTITSYATLTMFAQNNGYLRYSPDLGKLTVKAQGMVVKKDMLLGTVFDEISARGLEAARRDYQSALDRQKVGPGSAGPLQNAQSKVEMFAKLPGNSVPRSDRDAAQSEVARLQAAVDAERLELQRGVDAASTVMHIAEDQVRRTEIRSPFDGILTGIMYNDGAYVTINQGLFTVADTNTYVSGEVNEEDVGALRAGMQAEVRLYAYNSQTFDAKVTGILPSPAANSSRYTVTLMLEKPPENIMFGLTGEMNIILGRKPNSIVVPSRAVNVDQMLIVRNGVVEQRTVKLGFKSLEYTEVAEGISEGDAVIVSDQDAFRPGERVREVRTNQGKK